MLVYNSYGFVTSSVAVLIINGPPIITNQPQSQTVLAGTDVMFTVGAEGTQPFSYVWLFNGATAVGNGSSLTLANVQAANAGNYFVVLNNSYGSATSAVAVLAVLDTAPIILQQPQSRTVGAGPTVTFSVTARGTDPLGYQWRFNGADLPGKTVSVLTLTNVQSEHAGIYSVVVSNALGQVLSDPATLTVNPAGPQFSAMPANVSATRGAEVLFMTRVFGSEPIRLQWQFCHTNWWAEFVDVPGATTSLLELTNVQVANVGGYRAVAANAYGSATSRVALLSVTPPPGFLWARGAGGAGADGANCIAVDGFGNVCVAGYYFGSASLGESNLTVYGTTDLFVAKYDSAGRLLWVRTAGGSLDDIPYGIAADAGGNVYVTGRAVGDTDFGEVVLSGALGDVFLAKYDHAGNLLWVTKSGGGSSARGKGLALDAAGNVFVTGWFDRIARFGTNVAASRGDCDIFVAKYDGSGNLLWVRTAGGVSSDEGNGVATDQHGNVYVAGYFTGSATFGTQTIAGSTQEVFVAKYDCNGNLAWVAKAGGTGADCGRAICVDHCGNAYVTGDFAGTPTFGGVNLTATGSSGDPDIFVAEYDPAGNVLWAARAGGPSADYGRGISVDEGGNVYVTGDFVGAASFGNTNISGSGRNVFVAMYTAAAECRWVRQAGGPGTDYGEAVGTDDRGNVFLAGSFFTGPAVFGHVGLPSGGDSDLFVAKLAAVDPDLLPLISLQSSNQLVQAGADVAFTLGYISIPPVAIQWVFNGTNLVGATNTFLIISNATPIHAGNYSAILSNANGAVTSVVVTLTVTVEPDFVWALGMGGGTDDEILGVACDADGNTYVAGYFSGTISLGGTNLTSAGGEDIFVAKFDGMTNLVWIQRAGGPGDDRATCLALDGVDGVLVAGSFSETANFSGASLTSSGALDVFVARYRSASGELHWVQQAGGPGNDGAHSLATSSLGEVAVAGSFEADAAFGPTTVSSVGSNDMFVAKYNLAGNLLWARGGGGSGADRARSVVFDSQGNVLVGGSFSSNATIVTLLSSSNGLDGFVAKYDSTGHGLWARAVPASVASPWGGPMRSDDEVVAVAADPDGNIFIGGYFQNRAMFGNSTNTSVTTNHSDAFLAKYDSGGRLLWVRQAGGVLPDAGLGLTTDFAGNAYLAGFFSGTANFSGHSLKSVGGADMFATMYDATGKLLKVRRGGGAGDDVAAAIAVDGRGGAVVGGWMAGGAAFGATALANAGGRDGFVAKVLFFAPDAAPVITTPPVSQTASFGSNVTFTVGVSGSAPLHFQWQFDGVNLSWATNAALSITNVQYPNLGNYRVVVSNAFGTVTSAVALLTVELTPEFIWAQKAGGTGDDQARAIALDSETNLYVVGTFTGTATFFNTNFTSLGSTDIFLLKLSSLGSNLWARRAGGTFADGAQSVAADRSGNVYVAGYFQSSVATFESVAVTNRMPGTPDAFLAKYDGAGNVLWVRSAGGTGADQATCVAVDEEGNAYITGSYFSTATFVGASATDSISLTNLNSTNFFLAKYDPAGNVLWARTATGANTCQGTGVTVDAATNVYVTGFLLGTANFGSGSLTNTNGVSYAASVFLAKYDSAGTLQWANKGIGGLNGFGQAVRVDRLGNIYATAYCISYGTSFLLTKYDATGEQVWTRTASISCCTGGYINAGGLGLDPVGNPYIVGQVAGSASFGGLGLYDQGYVAKYGAGDGSLFWIRALGASGSGAAGYGVAVDGVGTAYIVGRFKGTASFGTDTLISSGGERRVYCPVWRAAAESCSNTGTPFGRCGVEFNFAGRGRHWHRAVRLPMAARRE